MAKRNHSVQRHANYTPEQWEQVRRNMEQEGYRSFQSFVRDRTLPTKQELQRGPASMPGMAALSKNAIKVTRQPTDKESQ